MKEIWKDIDGYDGLYRISNYGRVYSRYRRRLIKPIVDRLGYARIDLAKDGKHNRPYIHRLVALTFIGPPPGERKFINHIDFNSSNNRCTNLEWLTHKENMAHSRKAGRFKHSRESKVKMSMSKRGEKNNRSILKNSDIPLIFKIKELSGWSDRLIAELFGVNRRVVNGILNKKTWLNIS